MLNTVKSQLINLVLLKINFSHGTDVTAHKRGQVVAISCGSYTSGATVATQDEIVTTALRKTRNGIKEFSFDRRLWVIIWPRFQALCLSECVDNSQLVGENVRTQRNELHSKWEDRKLPSEISPSYS